MTRWYEGGLVRTWHLQIGHVLKQHRIVFWALVLWVATLTGKYTAVAVVAQRWLVIGMLAVLVLVWRDHVIRVAAVVFVAGLVNGATAWWVTDPPVTGRCEGVATFVDDPDIRNNNVSAVIKLHGVRYRAVAYARVSRKLTSRLMGEQVFVSGTCSPITGRFRDWDRQRHILGRMSIDEVREEFSSGSPLYRSANRLRRHIVDGISPMHPADQALFTGLVMGDDREQPRSMINSFRASGLSHLCAVSGQNVAYVLGAAGIFLRSRRLFMRLILTCTLLAWFVVLTRAEPSVVRAAVMAGIVAFAFTVGREAKTQQVLGITVLSLLCIDPMMARSVGFMLSTAATAGLAWLLPVTSRLVGQGPVRNVVAATLAATAGTAPISFYFFHHVPVVSMLANPVAVPIAGAVMLVGLPASLVLAFLPGPLQMAIAYLIEIPVRALWWIAIVCDAISPSGAWNVVCWFGLIVWCVRRYRRNHPAGKGEIFESR
jgi:competence protein ComEC